MEKENIEIDSKSRQYKHKTEHDSGTISAYRSENTKTKNQEIADYVNKKYNKSYTANYISTIFRQKIIPKINESVKFHALIIENICFSENFKRCSNCGKILLIAPDNFVRKARAKDGFSSQCKICDKKSRQFKKAQR